MYNNAHATNLTHHTSREQDVQSHPAISTTLFAAEKNEEERYYCCELEDDGKGEEEGSGAPEGAESGVFCAGLVGREGVAGVRGVAI